MWRSSSPLGGLLCMYEIYIPSSLTLNLHENGNAVQHGREDPENDNNEQGSILYIDGGATHLGNGCLG